MKAINLMLIYQKEITWFLHDKKKFRLQILDFRLQNF